MSNNSTDALLYVLHTRSNKGYIVVVVDYKLKWSFLYRKFITGKKVSTYVILRVLRMLTWDNTFCRCFKLLFTEEGLNNLTAFND